MLLIEVFVSGPTTQFALQNTFTGRFVHSVNIYVSLSPFMSTGYWKSRNYHGKIYVATQENERNHSFYRESFKRYWEQNSNFSENLSRHLHQFWSSSIIAITVQSLTSRFCEIFLLRALLFRFHGAVIYCKIFPKSWDKQNCNK